MKTKLKDVTILENYNLQVNLVFCFECFLNGQNIMLWKTFSYTLRFLILSKRDTFWRHRQLPHKKLL